MNKRKKARFKVGIERVRLDFRISASLKKALEAYCRRTDQGLGDAVARAIRELVGYKGKS